MPPTTRNSSQDNQPQDSKQPKKVRGIFTFAINRFLNTAGEVGSYILNSDILLPTMLGYFGGWLTGVGSHIGLLQGFSYGAIHSYLNLPFCNYVKRNEGNQNDEISPKAANFLRTAVGILGVLIPIALTIHFGPNFTQYLLKNPNLNWLIFSTATRPYGWVWGVGVSIAPVLAIMTVAAGALVVAR